MKRLATIFAFVAIVLAPMMASAVTVTTDLQGTLIKGSLSAVYFYGDDGKRYVFPNDKVFFSWYADFSSVKEITDAELAAIQIGGNVTYRPGTKLVKVTSDPRVYAVSGHGVLRWITTEDLAKKLYGSDWAKQVHDLSDSLFGDYEVGSSIASDDSYHPDTERTTYTNVAKLLSSETTSTESVSSSSEHTIVLKRVEGMYFSWTDTAVSSMGYKLVWSQNTNPTYPTREGDSYNYYSESSAKAGKITESLASGKTYYVRVCEYLGGKCGAYSNQVSFVAPTTSTETEDTSEEATSVTHTIVLKSNGGGSVSWTDTANSAYGYKVVYSLNTNPTYPTREGDTYLYYSEPEKRSTKIEDGLVSGKTYYVRVCEYLGGKCGAYSNQVSFVAPTTSTETTSDDTAASSVHTIVLSKGTGASFSWTDTAVSSMGYKLVWSQNTNPTYPTREGDQYIYYSESSTKSGQISESEAGTYYVRVCEYLGGKCGAYSNQVSFVAE